MLRSLRRLMSRKTVGYEKFRAEAACLAVSGGGSGSDAEFIRQS
jgi:hypothetical protein